jgi:hypothetical protein
VRDEQPRRISADVTALALTARAAADLQRSDAALIAAAADAVEDLATRDRVTALHFAYGGTAVLGKARSFRTS